MTVERSTGSFTIDAPARVRIDDRIDVAVARHIGGEVRVTVRPGSACRRTADGFVAVGAGSCTFDATQVDTATHVASPAMTRVVVVDKLIPSARIVAPPEVRVGQEFEVTFDDVVGPVPELTIEPGPCTGSPRSLRAVRVGPCRFTAVQDATDRYERRELDPVTVDVVRPIGSFDFEVTSPVAVDDRIELSISKVVGARPDITLIGGGEHCVSDSGSWYAVSVGTCVFEAVQGDDGTFAPAAPARRSVDVKDETILVVSAPRSATEGTTFAVGVRARADGPAPAMGVSGNCEIAVGLESLGRGLHAGRVTAGALADGRTDTCQVRVSQPATASYLAGSRDATIAIQAATKPTLPPVSAEPIDPAVVAVPSTTDRPVDWID